MSYLNEGLTRIRMLKCALLKCALLVLTQMPVETSAQRGPSGSNDSRAAAALVVYVEEILRTHPRVSAAQAAVAAASARVEAASRPIYNPELDAEYEDAESRTRSIGINQTLDFGNKRSAREELATAERQTAVEELALIRQAVSTELLAALGGYDVATDLVEIASERKDLMARFRAVTNERRAAGDLSQVEEQLAQLAYMEASLLHSQAVTEEVAAEQDLVRLSGAILPPPPEIPSDYIPVTFTESSIDSTLTGLPSVRVAQARIAAFRSSVVVRQRERRADPTIGLFAGREGQDDLVGVRFSIPLQVRNRYRAEVDAATADLEVVVQSVDDQYRQLRAELVASAKRYEISLAAWNEWLQVGSDSLELQIQVLEQLWSAGELSTTDYLVQLEQALDTQMAAVEQRGRLWADWIAWLAVSGQIDSWLGFSGTP